MKTEKWAKKGAGPFWGLGGRAGRVIAAGFALAVLFLSSRVILQAATINWTFTNPVLYVYNAAKILITGSAAELRNAFPLVADDTQAEFDAGTYTQSSYQTDKVALDPSVLPYRRTLQNGLIALWNFDETSGTATADLAGGYNGTLTNGAAFAAGKFGNGISLASTSSQHVATGHTLSPSVFTVAAWVNVSNVSSIRSIVGNYSGNQGLQLYITTGAKLELATGDNPNATSATSTSSIPLSTWTHVLGTFDGSVMKVYINGTQDGSSGFPGGYQPGASAFLIGLNYYPGDPFEGMIDEVLIYNRVLTASEITALATAVRSFKPAKNLPIETTMSGIVSYWNFDQGSGTTATDITGSINGTLTGGPLWAQAARAGSYSIKFDGSNDYVLLPDSASLSPGSGSCTVSAWIKPTSLAADQVVYQDRQTSNADMYLDVYTDGSVKFLVTDGTNTSSATSPVSSISAQRWYHVTGVKSGVGTQIYVNGTLAATGTNASLGAVNVSGNTAPRIGRSYADTLPFSGLIDDVAYFSRALTGNEIAAIYRARGQHKSTISDAGAAAPTWKSLSWTQSAPYGRPLEKPPIAYWKFEEQTGTTMTDSIGGFVGTFQNSGCNMEWSNLVSSNTVFSNTGSIKGCGLDSHVSVPHNTAMDPVGNTISLSAWIYNLGAAGRPVIMKGSLGGSTGYSIGYWNEEVNFNKIGVAIISAAMPTNQWVHVAGVANSTGMFLYSNGNLVASNSNSTNFVSQTENLMFSGSVPTGGVEGKLDELAIYDYALTPGEVAALGTGQKRPYVPADNYEKDLVGVWHMDSDGKDATQTSDGSETAMTYTPGVFAQAGSFNGTSSMISVPDATALNITTKLITVSTWIKTVTASKSILSKGTTGSSGYELAIDGSGYAVFKKGGTSLTGTTALTDSQWHHVLGTTNSSGNMFLYVDGVQENSNADTANFSTSSGLALKIGSNSANAYFNGTIDEAAVFKAGVTAAQALEIYKRGAVRSKIQVRADADSGMANDNAWSGGGVPNPGASAVWHLNETSGTNVPDTGGANNGTTTASPSWVAGGKIGGALSFDGNDAVTVTPSLGALSAYTLSVWYKTTDIADASIYTEGNTGDANPAVRLVQGAAGYELLFVHGDNAGNYRSCDGGTTAISSDGAWHHVAAIKVDANTLRLYRDGISISDCDGGAGGIGTTTTNTARIGARTAASVSEYFTGTLDEVALYPRAFSGEEVWKLYESGNFASRSDGEYLHGLNKLQYVQYRTTFDVLNDDILSPDIQSVTIQASGVYPKDTPTLVPSTAQTFNYVTDFAETATKPGGTEIKYILTPNNGTDWYYHNGSNWVASNQTYAQSSTASAINTNIASFDDAMYAASKIAANSTGNFNWKAFLSSTNATATPQLTQISAGVEAGTIAVAYPNGSEILKAASARPIYWTTTGTVPNDLTLEYATDGLNYTSLATTVSAVTHNEEKISGAVGVWHLDGGTSGAISNGTTVGFTDSVGSNNGTASNANAGGMAWAAGKITGSGAVSFDGTDDYISVPDSASLSPTTAVSLSAWVKTSAATQDIVTKGSQDYSILVTAGGNLGFYVTNAGSVTDSVSSIATLNNNAWRHVVGTFDGATSTLAVYVDGALSNLKVSSTVSDIRNSANPLEIANGSTGKFDGSIDDVAVFNRALSAGEIKAISDMGVNPGYVMSVPSILSNTVTVRAKSASAVVITDTSNANFEVMDLNIASPNGAEQIRSNAAYTISWAAGNNVPDDLVLEYSTNSGSSYSAIAGATGLAAHPGVEKDPATISGAGVVLRMNTATSGAITTGTNIPDSSANGLNGTAQNTNTSGMAWSTGKYNGAIHFDGVDDSLTVPNNAAIQPSGNAFSMTFWGKFAPGINRTIASTDAYQIDTAGGVGYLRFVKAGGATLVSSSSLASEFNWHHYAAVASSSGMFLYVDGALLTSNADTASFPAQTSALSFGGKTGDYMEGDFDDLAVFNRALTPGEVASLAGSGFAWTVPDIGPGAGSSTVRVRVRSASATELTDASDADFKVALLDITSPNGNELWMVGSSQNVTWTKSSNLTDFKVEYSINGGSSWEGTPISATTGNVSTVGWTIPDNVSQNTMVRVCALTTGFTSICDISDASFTIPKVTVTSPNGAEQFQVGSTKYISWTQSTGTPLDLVAEYSVDAPHSTWNAVSPAMNLKPTAIANHAGYWNFDETSGTTADDKSGVNDGTLTGGAQFVPGQFGNAVSYDGVDGTVTFSDAGLPAGNAARTLSAWIKTSSITEMYVIRYGGSGATQTTVLEVNVGKLIFNMTGGVITSTGNVNDNQWHHVAFVHDGASAQSLYIDGKVDGTGALTLATVLDGGGRIGSQVGQRYFNGLIDEPVIYSRALTAGEIAQLALSPTHQGLSPVTDNAATLAVVTGPQGIWHFDEAYGTNTTSADSSGTASTDATLTGGAYIANGLFGNAALFDGVDDNVTVDSIPAGSGDRSWAIWFKPTRLMYGTEHQNLFYGQFGNGILYIPQGTDTLRFCTANLGNCLTPSGSVLTENQWHHAAVTYKTSDTSVKVYINGAESNSGSFGVTLDDLYHVGSRASERFFKGSLDEFAVYNKVLTPVEVKILSGKASYSWTIPDAVSSTVKVRLRSSSVATLSDDSDANFIIEKIGVTSPNGAELWPEGTAHNITWQTGGSVTNVKIEYTTDGLAFNTILESEGTPNDGIVTNDGTFSWTVPNVPSTTVKIRITGDPETAFTDISDANFSIIDANITSQNSLVRYIQGQSQNITWTSSAGTPADLVLEYVADGTFNGDQVEIANSLAASGSQSWTVPVIVDNRTRIRLRSASVTDLTDTNDAAFIVARFILTSPNGGNTLRMGSTGANITWDVQEYAAGDLPADFLLEYSVDAPHSTWNQVTGATSLDPAGTASYNWNPVPSFGSIQSTVQVRLRSSATAAWTDDSNANFTIDFPTLTYTAPVLNQVVPFGTPFNITWTHDSATQGSLSTDLKIEYSLDGTNWPGGAQMIVAGSVENGGPVTSPFQWGVPQAAVSNTVKIRITDNQSTTTQVLTPFFKVTGSMTMQSPVGNEKWAAGFPHNIQWLEQGNITNVDIILYDSDPDSPLVQIATGAPNIGSYQWTPAYSDAYPNVKVRVSDASDPAVYTESTAVFTVSSISLGNPNARLLAGSTPNVIWSSAGVTNVKLEYSLLGDFSDTLTVPGCSSVPAGNLQCATQIPLNTVQTFRVRAVDADLPAVGDQALAFDESDSNAIIYGNIVVTAPNGGETLNSGNATTITWTTTPANANVIPNAKIQVAKNGNFNDNTGGNIVTLINSTPNHNVSAGSGSYSWTPTFTSGTSRVRVMDADAPSPVAGQDRDDSNGTFAVAGIAITSPTGGETALVNSGFSITFEYAGTTVTHVDIDYSPDGGSSWLPIVNNFNLPSNPYTYAGWTVPDNISTNAKIRVTDHNAPAVFSISTGVFSIKGTLSINTPADLNYTDGYTIQWTNTGSIPDVKLEYSPSGNFSGDEVTIITLTGLSGAQTPSNQSHLWTVPDVLKTTVKLRATDVTTRANGSPATSASSGVFSIHPIMAVTAPISSTAWAVNENFRNITWSITGTVANVKIEYLDEQDGYTTPVTIFNSTPNDGSETWTIIPDIVTLAAQNPQVDPTTLTKIRITDADAGHPVTTTLSDAFTVKWYAIEWRIKDVDSNAILQSLGVSDSSGWAVNDYSLNQVTGITRHYPYGTYTTTWSKVGYGSQSDDAWVADSDEVRTVYMQNDATASVSMNVKVAYTYDIANDTFQFSWWIERAGVLQTNPVLLFSGSLEVYPNGSASLLHAMTDGDGPNANGIYEATWAASGINTDNLYFAKAIIAFGSANSFKTSGITIDVRNQVEMETVNAGVAAIQNSTAAINTKIGNTTDTEVADTLFGKVQKLTSALGTVSDVAGTESVFGKIADQAADQVTILEEVQTNLPELIRENAGGAVKGGKGRMLQRTAKAYLGDTAEINFQFDTGAAPTIDIYDPANLQLISAGAMTEVSGTGIYGYPFKIPATYATGEYTVIVKESANGFMDSMILEVLKPAAKEERVSAAVVNAEAAAQSASSEAKRIWQEVMGIKGLLGSGNLSIGEQLGQVASMMGSLKGSIAVLTGGTSGDTAQPVTITTVHDALLDVMSEVRAVAGREGINMDAVYSSVAAQEQTTREIQNMVIATEAAAKTTQEILEKAQDKPVMTTWFENPKAV